jgi:O-methyltransferase
VNLPSRAPAARPPASHPAPPRPTDLYLDLLKRCLVNWVYADAETVPVPPQAVLGPDAARFLAQRGLHLVQPAPADPRARAEGRDWPPFAHTMVGLARLDNVQACVEDVLARSVPGDLLEAGVWRGGCAILMRGVLTAHGVTDRTVWLADSFAGLPPPDPDRFPADRGLDLHRFEVLAVSEETVRANFERYGLLDGQVRFLKGWFKDSLPSAPVGRLAVLRLDGDLYESTTDTLVHLYPKVSSGGFVIVDDYLGIAACRQAVDDYRRTHRIDEPIVPIDWAGVYWRRR